MGANESNLRAKVRTLIAPLTSAAIVLGELVLNFAELRRTIFFVLSGLAIVALVVIGVWHVVNKEPAKGSFAWVGAALVTVVALVGAPSATPNASIADRDNSEGCYPFTGPEQRLAQAINDEREANDLQPLEIDPELSRVALEHAENMIFDKILYHPKTSQLKKWITGAVRVGSNLGSGSTVESMHQAFLNSPVHREQELSPRFNSLGIAVRKFKRTNWVVLTFAAGGNPGTVLPMPECSPTPRSDS